MRACTSKDGRYRMHEQDVTCCGSWVNLQKETIILGPYRSGKKLNARHVSRQHGSF